MHAAGVGGRAPIVGVALLLAALLLGCCQGQRPRPRPPMQRRTTRPSPSLPPPVRQTLARPPPRLPPRPPPRPPFPPLRPPPCLPISHTLTPTSGLLLRIYTGVTNWTSDLYGPPAYSKFVPGVACCPSISSCAPQLAAVATKNFAAQFTGSLLIPNGNQGIYTLFLTANTSAALYLGGAVLIDNSRGMPPWERSATVSLPAGLHALRVVYMQTSAPSLVMLEWQEPRSGSRQVVHPDSLVNTEPPPVGCAGFLGGQSPDDCWCDAGCAKYGDCCPGSRAPHAPPPLPPPPPIASTPVAPGRVPVNAPAVTKASNQFARFRSKQAALAAFKATFTVSAASAASASPWLNDVRPAGLAAFKPGTIPEGKISAFFENWCVQYSKKYRTKRAKGQAYTTFRGIVYRRANRLSDITKPYWERWGHNLLGAARGPVFQAPLAANPPSIGSGPQNPTCDWRELGKVTPAKDQGSQCNACFAFVAVAAIESQLLINSNSTFATNPVDLSEQQIINCVRGEEETGFASLGCAGGDLAEPFLYASRGRNFLTTEEHLPYAAADGMCTVPANVTGRVDLAGDGFMQHLSWSPAALRAAVLEGPTVVGFHATEDFQNYAGGLWPANECSYIYMDDGKPDASLMPLNHALLVVGFNMTAQPPYWIVKNSCGGGASWGDNGFASIEMVMQEDTYGTCGMYAWVLRPTDVSTNTYRESVALAVFQEPRYNDLPLDTCRELGRKCGEPAASAFCQMEGFSHAVSIGPYVALPFGKTSFVEQAYVCNSGCNIFASITCGTRGIDGLVKFESPHYQGIPLDKCREWAENCGAPVAKAWCESNSLQSAVHVGPFYRSRNALGSTIYPNLGYTCQGGCSAMSEITCSTEVQAGILNFTSPRIDPFAAPLDYCYKAGGPEAECGWVVASNWCRLQVTMGAVAAIGPRIASPTGESIHLPTLRLSARTHCYSNCTTFAWVQCTVAYTAPPPPPPLPANNGLVVRVYTGIYAWPPSFAGRPVLIKSMDYIDCKGFGGAMDCMPEIAGYTSAYFAMQFSGHLCIPEGRQGNYTFHLISDDGSSFYLGGEMLIDNGGEHGSEEKIASLVLEAVCHTIRVDFWQAQGANEVSLQWDGPGTGGRQIVPPEVLYRSIQ